MADDIRNVKLKQDKADKYTCISFDFGPHHFVKVESNGSGQVTFALGMTHHGFKADASKLNGELECFINVVRKAHPENVVD